MTTTLSPCPPQAYRALTELVPIAESLGVAS